MRLFCRRTGQLQCLQLAPQRVDLRILPFEPLGRRATGCLLRGHVALQALHFGTLIGNDGHIPVHGLGDRRRDGHRLLPGGLRPQRRSQQRSGQRQSGQAAPHR